MAHAGMKTVNTKTQHITMAPEQQCLDMSRESSGAVVGTVNIGKSVGACLVGRVVGGAVAPFSSVGLATRAPRLVASLPGALLRSLKFSRAAERSY